MAQKFSDQPPSFGYAQFSVPYMPVLPPNAWKPFVEAVADWNAKLWTSVAAANGEYLNFLSKRAKADANFAKALSSCRTPIEIWQTYNEFMLGSAHDYRNEFGELATRWTAITSDTANTLADCAQTLTDVRTPKMAA